MATVDQIRNGLIDKILSIKNKAFLQALDQSEEDIRNGNLISQEAMDKRNLEWLKEM